MCMRVGLSHMKNGLLSALALSRNISASSRIYRRVVDVGRDRAHHVARTDLRPQVLRVVGMAGIFHRVEVIEIAEELVEAVHRRQELVLVAEMVLAELAGG